MINLKSSILKVNRGTPVYFLILIFICFSCKKDKVDNIDNCVLIKECDQITQGGYEFEVDFSNIYDSPRFNPNNENEFIYIKRHSPDYYSSELYVYNLSTNVSNKIYSDEIWYSPQWNKNDWILFSTSDKNIYLIKSNGDSLTQVTSTSCYHYPFWYFDAEKIIVYDECLQKNIVMDIEGNVEETLPKLISARSDVSKKPYIVTNTGPEGVIKFYNYESENLEFYYDYSSLVNQSNFNGSGGGSLFWINDNEIIFSNNNFGIRKLNISSLKSEELNKSCNSRVYRSGSLNNSKTKMLWARGDYTQIDECKLTFKQDIYIMNMDGSDEEKVDLN